MIYQNALNSTILFNFKTDEEKLQQVRRQFTINRPTITSDQCGTRMPFKKPQDHVFCFFRCVVGPTDYGA